VSAGLPAATRPSRLRAFAMRLRTAAWLGWQVDANWADPFLFVVYTIARPLATSLILVAMYWAARGASSQPEAFTALWLGNAFHTYVITVVIGMGWAVVEEREEYETLKYVYTSPIGMFTYLAGRASIKMLIATFSVGVLLMVGWWLLGVRWDLAAMRPLLALAAFAVGVVATAFLGLLVAGMMLLLPRVAITLNESIGIALYLLCGVIFPIDLLPRGLQELSLGLPFTWWYEALRRCLLGHGASERLSALPDAAVFGALLATTALFAVVSARGYGWLERRARKLGRLDQTSLF
jgi:ABC-2 type transport system permease protein